MPAVTDPDPVRAACPARRGIEAPLGTLLDDTTATAA
jgi:hypothetical protein